MCSHGNWIALIVLSHQLLSMFRLPHSVGWVNYFSFLFSWPVFYVWYNQLGQLNQIRSGSLITNMVNLELVASSPHCLSIASPGHLIGDLIQLAGWLVAHDTETGLTCKLDWNWLFLLSPIFWLQAMERVALTYEFAITNYIVTTATVMMKVIC